MRHIVIESEKWKEIKELRHVIMKEEAELNIKKAKLQLRLEKIIKEYNLSIDGKLLFTSREGALLYIDPESLFIEKE